MMNDLMVDLETLSTSIRSVIISMAVVQCNLATGEVGQEFYRVLNIDDQLENGRVVSGSTISWWLSQSKDATATITEMQENKKPDMFSIISAFNTFCMDISGNQPHKLRLWGNGATFDCAILRDFYETAGGYAFPIPFRNDRDCRTIMGLIPPNLAQEWFSVNKRKGAAHHALTDAKYQIEYISHFLKEAGVSELY